MNIKARQSDRCCRLLQIETWRAKHPEDYIFFRPHTAADDEGDVSFHSEVDEDDVAYHEVVVHGKKLESSLLFIYMSRGQKEVFKR